MGLSSPPSWERTRGPALAYPCSMLYFLADAGGDRRRLGLRGGRAAAAVRRPSRASRWSWPGPTPRRAGASPSSTPRWPRPTRRSSSRRRAPTSSPASTSSSWPSRTARPRRWPPGSSAGSGSSWTCPPTSGCATPAAYPRWYGHEHAAPGLLDRFVYGLPELFRPELAGATPGRRARVLPDGGGAGAGPARARRCGRSRRASSWTPPAGCRARGASWPHTTHFTTVDEDFTAYGLLHHRHTPEIEQATRGPGGVHPAPGPDEPRHPGHLLRAPRGRRSTTDDALGDPRATRTALSPSWW